MSRAGRVARAPGPLVVVVAAVLGIGALGGATGAVLGGVSLAAAEIEGSEHGAQREGGDAPDLRDDGRGENEHGGPAPAPVAPAPVAPAPVGPVPPGR